MDGTTKQALLAVVQVWLDRLQTMAVITTFFVSIDSMLYGYASVSVPPNADNWSNADLLKSATLGGSIILHVCASILAYLASFVLIRYRLDDAEEQAQTAERPSADIAHEPLDSKYQSTRGAALQPSASTTVRPVHIASRDFRSLVSVYQVKPFGYMQRRSDALKAGPETPDTANGDAAALVTLQSMVRTLTRCHTVVAVMSNVGFVLALIGTITYFWTAFPVALGSFASVCLGLCLLAGGYAVM
ncbi:uncharacterized protein TRAVEDRAFT_52133 [Trametes versicolor FP-101664 SS1]|uniref:uncharacterized protein n=1 Tax=Trametes versicolor (strain FP-101664) TaxID=717944 RepID=UPI0004621E77|nr:uncharacterized protein TRAVEDRAFT_52133 [Trametes versicolor FP-101664 SS1]EIW54426.1 hypothetical protein TRAVEDRAFT_52133 [Trametes versicolor FP-101664 SS1]